MIKLNQKVSSPTGYILISIAVLVFFGVVWGSKVWADRVEAETSISYANVR